MATADISAGGRGPRLAAIDAARGVAILAMVVYHFSWDLGNFRLVGWNAATDFGWRLFARAIAASFLVLVGVSLVLAARNGLRLVPFLRRLAVIIGAAALVSLGTWWFAPDAVVFFGILHMIALGSVLAVPFLLAPSWLIALAALAVVLAPQVLPAPFFDTPALWWLGLAPVPPRSVDYVPLLPWFAPILAGLLIGRAVVAAGPGSALARWTPSGRLASAIVTAGRWSLLIYLVHQPLLLGALWLAEPYLPVNQAAEARAFKAACVSACRTAGTELPVCETYCTCVYAGLGGTPLMTADRAVMSPAETARWDGIVGQCRRNATALEPAQPAQ